MRKLVNEKTLELRISHELMNWLGYQIFGLTQRDESLIGADIEYYSPVGNPYIIQFKAAQNGNDGIDANFRINNNQPNYDQHIILNMAAIGGINAIYLFPLVVSDQFLIQQFNRLLLHTLPIEADRITGNLNWNNQAHRIYVDGLSHTFKVLSNEYHKGDTEDMKTYLSKLRDEINIENKIDINFEEYVYQNIYNLENQMKEKEIHGEREHTFYFFGINEDNEQIIVFQIPIWLKGLTDKYHEHA